MNLFGGVTRSLAGLAIVAVILALLLMGILATGRGRQWLGREAAGRQRGVLALALMAAAIAMAGSLYFSDVVGFRPCLFCWYQRIAMYPLVPVLGVALLLRDGSVWRYVLPLSGIGLLLSIYHTIIELQPNLAVVGTCDTEAPCTVRLFAILGFISIPVLAGSAFLLISALMLLLRNGESESGS